MFEVVLRRPRGVIRVRVIEPEQAAPRRVRLRFGAAIRLRADEEPAPALVARDVLERHCRLDVAGNSAQKRSAALVGVSARCIRVNVCERRRRNAQSALCRFHRLFRLRPEAFGQISISAVGKDRDDEAAIE